MRSIHTLVRLAPLYPSRYPATRHGAGLPRLAGVLERTLAQLLHRRAAAVILGDLIQRYLRPMVAGGVDRLTLERMLRGGEPIYPDLLPTGDGYAPRRAPAM